MKDEASRCVNFFSGGRKSDGTPGIGPANYVPAAAVIRKVQALTGITGRKASAGGGKSLLLNTGAQHRCCNGNFAARGWERSVELCK